MTCVDNKSVKDICDRKCECQDGGLASCYRVRKEFTKMSLEERTHYLKVFKLLATDPRYSSEYEKIGKVHTVVPGKELFFPWHRWYVLTFENLLRQIDCRITIPYWDWTKDAAHWTRGSEIEDVWNPGPHGLGGNGVFPINCVMDGSFKKGEYSLPQSAGGNCLKRHFNYSCTLQNAEQAKEIIKQPSYTALRDTIYNDFHQTYHKCVGATLAFFKTAPYSPEFWLLHSFLDKLWVDWKKNNMDSKSDLTDIKYLMYETGHYAWEYLDADHLPGNVQVSYEE